MDQDTQLAVIHGATLERVLRSYAVLLAVGATAVMVITTVLDVQDGVPPVARFLGVASIWAVTGLVLRTPLTEPSTAVRNQRRVELFHAVTAGGTMMVEAISAPPVLTMVLLSSIVVASLSARLGTTITIAAGAVAANLIGTSRTADPDWASSIAFVALTGGLAWAGLATVASYRHSVARQVTETRRGDRYAAQLRMVAESARQVHVLDPELVLDGVSQVTRMLGWDVAVVTVIDDFGGADVRASHGTDSTRGNTTAVPWSLHTRTIERSSTVVVRDDASSQDADATLGRIAVGVGTPITVDGAVLGTLSAGRRDPTLDDSDVLLLELLAEQAGRALEAARSFETQSAAITELERLAKLKEDFLATVSHELRTPLHVVLGMSETLTERWSDLDDHVRHDLSTRLHGNAQALNATIESLLDFSRLEAGAIEIEAREIDLSEIARVVVQRHRDAGESSVSCEATTEVQVHADPRLIERVIDNLLTNAVKHTPRGTTVVVSVQHDGPTGRVAVTDQGQGIPEHEQKLVRERFYRSGDVLRRESRGIGLGLAFCSEVLALHGSQLDLQSIDGGGCTFSFTLERQAPIVR